MREGALMEVNRGWTGIGIYGSKFPVNIGTLVRSARCFNVDFVFTIGARYKKSSAAVGHDDHIPIMHFDDWFGDAADAVPDDSRVVCVENTASSRDLRNFQHPERAIYLLGAEDYGIPDEILEQHQTVSVDSEWCLNVSVAGSLVMYDRTKHSKQTKTPIPGKSLDMIVDT